MAVYMRKRLLIPLVVLLIISLSPFGYAYSVPSSTIVLVAKGGDCYHRSGCTYLDGAETYSVRISEAESRGYRACSRCKPDSLTGEYQSNWTGDNSGYSHGQSEDIPSTVTDRITEDLVKSERSSRYETGSVYPTKEPSSYSTGPIGPAKSPTPGTISDDKEIVQDKYDNAVHIIVFIGFVALLSFFLYVMYKRNEHWKEAIETFIFPILLIPLIMVSSCLMIFVAARVVTIPASFVILVAILYSHLGHNLVLSIVCASAIFAILWIAEKHFNILGRFDPYK